MTIFAEVAGLRERLLSVTAATGRVSWSHDTKSSAIHTHSHTLVASCIFVPFVNRNAVMAEVSPADPGAAAPAPLGQSPWKLDAIRRQQSERRGTALQIEALPVFIVLSPSM